MKTKITLGQWVMIWMLVVISAFCLTTQTWGSARGHSWEGVYWGYSFEHWVDMDSGYTIFYYPDTSTTNSYDTVVLTPNMSDSSVMTYDSLDLDSIGTHSCMTYYYEQGETGIDSASNLWYHAVGTRISLGITSPLVGTLCNVYGYLRDGGGNPLIGAVVTGKRVGSGEGIDTSSTTAIISGPPVSVVTDTAGLFQLNLQRTTSLADTSKGFYEIKGTFGGEKVFEVKQYYVPDQDSTNIGDTILAR